MGCSQGVNKTHNWQSWKGPTPHPADVETEPWLGGRQGRKSGPQLPGLTPCRLPPEMSRAGSGTQSQAFFGDQKP